jgi:hypothetical protein
MREIKFRALRTDGKGWVIGDLVHKDIDAFSHRIEVGIRLPNCYPDEVIPETVGQYAGLKDKNGVDVYEGDEVTYSDKSTSLTVGFESGSFVLKRDGKTYVYNINSRVLEVIGNIHESATELKEE